MRDILVCLSDPQLFILLKHVLAAEGFCAVSPSPETEAASTTRPSPCAIVGECPDHTRWLAKLAHWDRTAGLPLVVLARGEDADLQQRANCILRQPFDPMELIRFIRQIDKRETRARDEDTVCFEDIQLHVSSHQIRRNGKSVELTALQFRLLTYLMRRPETVCGREELIEACWPADAVVEPRTVDIHIGEIRRRLASRGPNLIRTVRGVGYSLTPHIPCDY